MGRANKRGKRKHGARSSSPATRGGRGGRGRGRGREGEVDGGNGSSSMAGRGERSGHGHGSKGHDGGGCCSPTSDGQGTATPPSAATSPIPDGQGTATPPSAATSPIPDGQGTARPPSAATLPSATPPSAAPPSSGTPPSAATPSSSGTPPSAATPPSSGTPPSAATPPSSGTPPSAATLPATPPSSGTPPAPHILGSDSAIDNYANRVTISKEERAAHFFCKFLETYMGSSLGDAVYVAEVKSMRAKKIWKLQIHFHHLRSFSRPFACYVCNNKRRIWDWLLSAVRKFLIAQCVDAKAMASDIINSITNDIMLHTELEFIGIPKSIESLSSFLNRNSDALTKFMKICFETRETVLLSSPIGSHTCQACIQYLIENHIQGRSWKGDFTLQDWDVINGHVVELMKHSVPFSPEYGAKDLGQIDSLLLPCYVKTDKDGNKTVPLYFRELDIDLMVTSASIKSEDDLRWYREYILSHPAIKPPMARVHLIRGFFREIQTYNLFADPVLKPLLTDAKESCYSDWRTLITLTKSNVLLDIYWHGIPKADRATATPKFNASLESLLGFKRNSCEHIEERSRDKRGKQLMKTCVEAEVFPASKVTQFLPFLIKNLLMKCDMKGRFSEVWQEYKDSGFKSKLGIQKATG